MTKKMAGSRQAQVAHLVKGQQAENFACDYLITQGLTLVRRNYRTHCGEIDLIMLDDSTLVFIEVRYRKNNRYGGASASVNYKKQQHIRNTAALYCQKQNCDYPSRFDVCAIHGNMQINWIKQAF